MTMANLLDEELFIGDTGITADLILINIGTIENSALKIKDAMTIVNRNVIVTSTQGTIIGEIMNKNGSSTQNLVMMQVS